MKEPKYEILLKDNDNNEPLLARVLLEFKIPIVDKSFGTWCYFINSKEGLYIFETGMKYKTSSLILRGKKKKIISRKTNNSSKIIYILDKLFPNKKIKEIILSHYHQDHSEIAPELQEILSNRQDIIVPIRVHKNEMRRRKFFHFKNYNLESVFIDAGYKSWTLGKHIDDNEKFGTTGFRAVHLPGHTKGNIGLINDELKIAIVGLWSNQDTYKSKLMKFGLHLINENYSELRLSKRRFTKLTEGYNIYYIHSAFREGKIGIRKRIKNKIVKTKNNIIKKRILKNK